MNNDYRSIKETLREEAIKLKSYLRRHTYDPETLYDMKQQFTRLGQEYGLTDELRENDML
ncbi:MAG: hypothetical protein K5663_06510 [Clostridiales bacterium]|nr:hypothetical protein [Clostridiales bacterium]